jgi:hypothetical protein
MGYTLVAGKGGTNAPRRIGSSKANIFISQFWQDSLIIRLHFARKRENEQIGSKVSLNNYFCAWMAEAPRLETKTD